MESKKVGGWGAEGRGGPPGNIRKHGKDSIQYRVSSIKDLKVIIDHFDKYPLITQKLADYLLFKQFVEILSRKEHLTKEGLQQIVNPAERL